MSRGVKLFIEFLPEEHTGADPYGGRLTRLLFSYLCSQGGIYDSLHSEQTRLWFTKSNNLLL